MKIADIEQRRGHCNDGLKCVIRLELTWCPGPELNRYVLLRTRDFKSRASASFATRAGIEVLEKTISVH